MEESGTADPGRAVRWVVLDTSRRISESRHLSVLTRFHRTYPVVSEFLCYLCIAILPTLVSCRLFQLRPHGYVNVECLLIGAVGLFMPRTLVVSLLMLDTLAGFAYSVCYTYQFSLRELVVSANYASFLPAWDLEKGLGFLVALVLVSLLAACVRPRKEKRERVMFAMLFAAALIGSFDMAVGQNPLFGAARSLVNQRLARSPVVTLSVREFASYRVQREAGESVDDPSPSASSQAMAFLSGERAVYPDLVLVLVESWGLLSDAHTADSLTDAYADPALLRRYNVRKGEAPYAGLTVPGEARELCRSTIGFGIMRMEPDRAGKCLPEILHSLGYEDIALHGYVGQMFSREIWYRKLGFDRMVFGPEFRAMNLASCRGAFPGICDASIANWIGDTLLAPRHDQPKFVYWVTLNSHLPVPAQPDLPDDGSCQANSALHSSESLCSWSRLIRNVHHSIHDIAVSKTSRPTVFVVVGDHAPPFGDSNLMSQFSDQNVPYVILTPRSTQN